MAYRLGVRTIGSALALGIAAIGGSAAEAAPEEIQVYMDEMDKPGHFGLDTHLSYVATGDRVADTPGGELSLHRFRVTPEFSYGITNSFEAGLYLPLATIDQTGKFRVEGAKFRLKYIAPHEEHDGKDWWYGLNFEIGKVDHRLDENPWNSELKAILGTKQGRWTIAWNLNLDFVVSGPNHTPADLDFDTKVAYAVTKKVSIGVESYNGIGTFHHVGDFRNSDQSLFGVIDTSFSDWDLNLGVGRGYGTSSDHWLVKAIVGVPLERLFGRKS